MDTTSEYSIAAARANLTKLVREVEEGTRVRLTRRGKPVAVLISSEEYVRLTSARPDLGTAIAEFRARTDLADLDIDEVYREIRDRGPGREVDL